MSSLKFPQNFDETRDVKMDDVLLVADESKAEDPDCVKKAKISSIINAAGSPVPQIEKDVGTIKQTLENKADKEQVANIGAHLEESIDTVEAKVDTNTNKISEINTVELPKKLEDAPKDTKQYARQDGTWKQVVDNFVVLSESQYNNLKVKDPNKFYYVYDDEEPSEDEHIEGNILYGEVESNVYLTKGTITNNILKI